MPDQPAICSVPDLYADENVWLSQRMMAQLYDVEVPTINCHLKEVFSDSEIEEGAVTQEFRISAGGGKSYDTRPYNLSGLAGIGIGPRIGPSWPDSHHADRGRACIRRRLGAP